MDSKSNSSILGESKEHIASNEFPDNESSINNSNANNNFDPGVNNDKDTFILKHDSISYNSIEFSNSNKLSLSSNFYKNEKSKIKNNYRIICKNCYNFTQIIFNDNNTLNILCDCKKIENMKYNYFMRNYIIKNLLKNENESKIIVDNYCFCEIHYKPYHYFWPDCSRSYNKICGRNLCEDCIRDKNLHSNHKIYSYDNNLFDNVQNIAKFIIKHDQKKILNNSENEQLYEHFNGKFEQFLTILKMVLISSKYYFCYNIYNTIISANNYLDKLQKGYLKSNKNEIILVQKDVNQKQLINIKEKKEFIYIKNNKYHEKIKSIEIIKNNFNDISILNNTNLIILETLSLPDNNIKDISSL